MSLSHDAPVAVDKWSHVSVGAFRDKSKEEGISAHFCLGKVAWSRGSTAKEKQLYFVSSLSSFPSFFSFIALTMLGTNIKLNIYSIQTMKALKKRRTRTKQKLLQLISKTSLYYWTAFWPWNPYFSAFDFQAYYCLSLNLDRKNFEWRIRDGGQCFLILKMS